MEKNFAPGGQITATYEVDNYPGMPGISGMDLGEAFGEHARKLGLEPKREKILSLENISGDIKTIHTKKNEYQARTIILAFGAEHRKLDIPGEDDLGGLGVSYCATCDGAFYKDRTAVVVGGGNAAAEDAVFLSGLCKKVYLVHRRDELRADKAIQEKVFDCENIEMVWERIYLCRRGRNHQRSRRFCSGGYPHQGTQTGGNCCFRRSQYSGFCTEISLEERQWQPLKKSRKEQA